MADVFIDYEARDREAAAHVAAALLARGLSSFVIDRDLAPGERSAARVGQAAADARVIVVLWSAAAVSALRGRGALERAGEFIRYWSEGRLVLARLDAAELPLGLRGLASVPLRAPDWDGIAGAVAALSSALAPAGAELGDHDWEGITQVWSNIAPPPAVAPLVPSRELGDHDWQGATQVASDEGAPAANPLFVSYAHKDLARVDPIVGEISALGFPVWMDREEMSSIAGWAGQITRAIKSSRAIVLMASSSSYASDQVVREMYLAMNAKKKIVPLELETATMTDEFEYILAPFQRFAVDAPSRAAVLTRALKSI